MWAPSGRSYTRDREARRRRLKERGVPLDEPAHTHDGSGIRCRRCADTGEVIVQGRGRVTCPSCGGDAA